MNRFAILFALFASAWHGPALAEVLGRSLGPRYTRLRYEDLIAEPDGVGDPGDARAGVPGHQLAGSPLSRHSTSARRIGGIRMWVTLG